MTNKRELILQKIDLFERMYQNNLIQNKDLMNGFTYLENKYKCKINPVTLDITFKRGRKKNSWKNYLN